MTESSRRLKYPGARIAVFAREPRLGQVKSRLATRIGESAALAIYRAMLQRVGELLLHCDLADWTLWVTSNPSHKSFLSLCNKKNIFLQSDGDLGARMLHTLRESLRAEGTEAVLLIGTDCPALDVDYLDSALAALSAGNDIVLGPAEDGGYVLPGAPQAIPALFEDVEWGTDRVLSTTIERLQTGNYRYALLDSLWDVDRPDDLERLETLSPPLQWLK